MTLNIDMNLTEIVIIADGVVYYMPAASITLEPIIEYGEEIPFGGGMATTNPDHMVGFTISGSGRAADHTDYSLYMVDADYVGNGKLVKRLVDKIRSYTPKDRTT